MRGGDDGPAQPRKKHPQAQLGKNGSVAAPIGRISGPVLGGIGHREGGAVSDFDRAPAQQDPGWAEVVGVLGGGAQRLGKRVQRQAGFAAAVGAILGGELGALLQIKEGLELADHLATGGQRD